MTQYNYNLAEKVNSDINSCTSYTSDLQQFGIPEFWTESGKFGDCEDYALRKRHVLLSQNWPIDKINLCCGWVETGEYHCVLLVETGKGFFILDNRYNWPMTPKSLPYKWDKIERGGKWFELSF